MGFETPKFPLPQEKPKEESMEDRRQIALGNSSRELPENTQAKAKEKIIPSEEKETENKEKLKAEFEERKKEMEEQLEKRTESQRQFLVEAQKSGLPFILTGGWAAKIEEAFGDKYNPRDIDMFLKTEDWAKWEEFLKSSSFGIEDMKDLSKKVCRRENIAIDMHFLEEQEKHYTETAPHGTFFFPKEGFDTQQWEGGNITVSTPELMYILEKGGPEREGKQKRLEAMEKQIDYKKLDSLSKDFKYVPNILEEEEA